MTQITQAEAEALISTTLQTLIGRGVDSANFNIAITSPGGVGTQPHRNNVIGSAGVFDGKTQQVVVRSAARNRVNQGGKGAYTPPKPVPSSGEQPSVPA